MTDIQEKPTMLDLRAETPPTTRFRWRDRHGEFHPITEMETRHLFYSLRMIWNHHMPPAARSSSYKRYRFGPEYSAMYLAEAIAAMVPMLLGRGDLQPEWRAEIDRWLVYLGHVDPNAKEIAQ